MNGYMILVISVPLIVYCTSKLVKEWRKHKDFLNSDLGYMD